MTKGAIDQAIADTVQSFKDELGGYSNADTFELTDELEELARTMQDFQDDYHEALESLGLESGPDYDAIKIRRDSLDDFIEKLRTAAECIELDCEEPGYDMGDMLGEVQGALDVYDSSLAAHMVQR